MRLYMYVANFSYAYCWLMVADEPKKGAVWWPLLGVVGDYGQQQQKKEK